MPCIQTSATFQLCTQKGYQVPPIDRIACNSGTPEHRWSAAKGAWEKLGWSFTWCCTDGILKEAMIPDIRASLEVVRT
ncbi:hypothetical protein ILYODFUR_005150 [Ilyodon furcidens]|uniref:Uncharacterized protein n=1 Tax=Ilyodon furcidens TaxID=33524 RepID=A0ABV0VE22_9TELE